ncbi:MAG: hypothetical protein PHU06_06030 [Gallionella sp.]|nr:hypothetical protein [Gallionella sp.]MDD4958402.1 hypothetical protein [Gallionella sp.]
MEDRVFRIRENGVEVWKIRVDDRILGDWSQRGPAEAGLQVEQRRAAARKAKQLEQN